MMLLLSGAFCLGGEGNIDILSLVLPACFSLDLVSFGATRSYCDPLTFFFSHPLFETSTLFFFFLERANYNVISPC